MDISAEGSSLLLSLKNGQGKIITCTSLLNFIPAVLLGDHSDHMEDCASVKGLQGAKASSVKIDSIYCTRAGG